LKAITNINLRCCDGTQTNTGKLPETTELMKKMNVSRFTSPF